VVVDDCTRECLALIADTSISGIRVARKLDRLLIERGKPETIVSDNGTEFTSNAILHWADDHKVAWHYIAPGKPAQNAFAESFIGRLPPDSNSDWIRKGGNVSGMLEATKGFHRLKAHSTCRCSEPRWQLGSPIRSYIHQVEM
jgi:transposase InsO family protein